MSFLLGGVAGALTKTMVAPIERIKVIVQTSKANLAVKDSKN